MGGDEAFNASGVKAMFKYAWNIAHVKDAEDGAGPATHRLLKRTFRDCEGSRLSWLLLDGIRLESGPCAGHETPDPPIASTSIAVIGLSKVLKDKLTCEIAGSARYVQQSQSGKHCLSKKLNHSRLSY